MEELVNILLNPYHPVKIVFGIVCLIFGFVFLIDYFRYRRLSTFGSAGLFFILVFGMVISMLYPKIVSQEMMVVIQIVNPILALSFYYAFQKKMF
ncbi:MAG: hypothetical protein PHV17_06445 [Candidatus Omnitrophica bacterium]|nr:hypothetical protein [Candidatus Omnitrophota bacterium]